jgi:[protein-PII] uridylyltransferase
LWKNINENYFGRFSSSQLEWQAQSIIKVKADDDVIELRQNFESLLEIFIKVKNMNGLFLRLVEIFDSLGVEIIDADIATTKDQKIALNTFIASYKYKSKKLTQNDIKDLLSKIHAIFDGTKIIKRIVHDKNGNSHFKNPTKITESVDEENRRNIITIETINSSGLLVKIAEIFKNYEASIHSAKITTLGEKVEDTFFIEDLRTNLISRNKMQSIKKALSEII